MCWEPSFIRWFWPNYGDFSKLGDFPKPKPPIWVFFGSCEATIIWPDDWYGNGYIQSLGTNSHPLSKGTFESMLFLVGCISSMEGNFAFFVCNFLNKNVDQKKTWLLLRMFPSNSHHQDYCTKKARGRIHSIFWKYLWMANFPSIDVREIHRRVTWPQIKVAEEHFLRSPSQFPKNSEVLHLFAAETWWHNDDLENDLDPGNFSEVICPILWGLCLKRRDTWNEVESVSRRTGKWLSNMESFLAKQCRFIHEQCSKNVSDIPLFYLVHDVVLKMVYEKMIPHITEQYHHSLV